PLVALARADRFVRTGAAMLDELDVADLDPADRGAWGAADWARAEAAGLIVLAAPPPVGSVPAATEVEADGTPPLPPLPPRHDDLSGPVWWDDARGEWLTCFPVAEGEGWPHYERGTPDDEEGDYERSLTPGELLALEAARAALLDDPLPDPHAERDAWFAGLAEAVAAAEAGSRGAEHEGGETDFLFPRESGGPGAASDVPCDPGLLRSQEKGRASEERAAGPDVSAG
ncbi:hypothetical protein, partial [uncultured Sphingomonas sp.]|uniref:hypothetical protein n=1 Tax=uncultured Sphingomonas sp. TaxID=158754 RepID=UPI0035C9C5EB